MNRPDAALLAKWSYYLSYVTSGLLLLGILFGFARSPLAAILWLAFLPSAVGALMAWMSKSEFKRINSPDAASLKMARQGWRVNFSGFIMLILILVITVILSIFLSQVNEPSIDPAVTPAAVLLFGI